MADKTLNFDLENQLTSHIGLLEFFLVDDFHRHDEAQPLLPYHVDVTETASS